MHAQTFKVYRNKSHLKRIRKLNAAKLNYRNDTNMMIQYFSSHYPAHLFIHLSFKEFDSKNTHVKAHKSKRLSMLVHTFIKDYTCTRSFFSFYTLFGLWSVLHYSTNNGIHTYKINAYIHIYIHTYIHKLPTYVHTYISTYISTYVHTYVDTFF